MAAPGGCAPDSEADRGHCPEAELGREGGQRRAGISRQVSPQQSPTGQTGSVRGHTPWTTQVAFRAPLSPNTLSSFLLQIPCWNPAFLLESPTPSYWTTFHLIPEASKLRVCHQHASLPPGSRCSLQPSVTRTAAYGWPAL